MKHFVILVFVLNLLACNNDKAGEVKTTASHTKTIALKIPEVKFGIEGFYTGGFKATEDNGSDQVVHVNKITVCIDSLTDQKIFGHSIVAGNERPFSGDYSKEGDSYSATLFEPGDNKYDGVFRLNIFPADKKIKGTWEAKNKTIPVTAREYELVQKTYKYDPSLALTDDVEGAIAHTYNEETQKAEIITEDAIRFNASEKLLSGADVENMYKADLELMRNAIYARHGYSFRNIRMRDIFDNYVSWYMPVSTNVSSYLTELEQKNITLIKRYEAHATKYYDEFGR